MEDVERCIVEGGRKLRCLGFKDMHMRVLSLPDDGVIGPSFWLP